MAIKLSAAVKNARLDAIETAIGASAVLKIRSGAAPAAITDADSGTVLATLALPADWLAAADAGAKAKSGTWEDATAATLAGASLSGAGTVEVEGAAAVSLAGASVDAAGSVEIHGSAGITLAGASLSAAGQAMAQGAGSIWLAAATLSASGQVETQGAGAGVLADAVVSASGWLEVQGAGAVSLADGTVNAVGRVGVYTDGWLEALLADATVSASGMLTTWETPEDRLRTVAAFERLAQVAHARTNSVSTETRRMAVAAREVTRVPEREDA